MRPETITQLRALLRQRLAEHSYNASQNEGVLTREAIDELERLARLVELAERMDPPAHQKRWALPAVLLATLFLVSALLFFRVPETAIELNLKLTGLRFELAQQQVLFDALRAEALGISGLAAVRLPRSRGRAASVLTAERGKLALKLETRRSGHLPSGTITLTTLRLPAGTRVWLQAADKPRWFRLAFQAGAMTLRVNVHGQISAGTAAAAGELLDFPVPRSIRLQTGASETLTLDFALDNPANRVFLQQLIAQNLSFIRVEQYADASGNLMPQYLSSILEGKLYLESLNGIERRLRQGERLRFDASYGMIRALRLSGGQILFEFAGSVRGMRTGSAIAEHSMMPTWLEWLKARHALALLWGSTIYLFGLLSGVWRWWKSGG